MSNLPVSALIKQGEAGDDVSHRRTKDEYRKQKDLEEQRKAGTAPAMVDVETGRDINPHIPEFIEKTPWYVPTAGPTLLHQRPHPERQKQEAQLNEWYQKGTTGKTATKFRKGACENCGAMGHKKKDCFERPRQKGAKFTEANFAPDDHVPAALNHLSYVAKRDRWNGYDAASYKAVIEEHEAMEDTRKMIKARDLQDGLGMDEQEAEERLNQQQDEDKYADDASVCQSVDMDSRTRITVRNLRIREDTAKYLYNLDPNGPYYDPKSRSMRDNPFAGRPGKEQEAAKFAGENFVRYTGEVMDANKAQVFSWAAKRKGVDVHPLAEPTKLEQLKKAFDDENTGTKGESKQKLLDKYGGEEHMQAPPRELLMSQSENYVEYNRMGKVIKGAEKAALKSKYEEDVYPGNHTSVFGSWYKNGQWGFKCCHSTYKNSYCVGEKGYELEMELPSDTIQQRLSLFKKKEGEGEVKEVESEKKEKKDKKVKEKEDKSVDEESGSSSSGSSSSSSSSSESEDEEEKKKTELKKALKKVKKDKLDALRKDESVIETSDRKRKYHSNYEEFGKKPTEAEQEAYHLTKTLSSDPMASQMEEKWAKKAKKTKKD